MAKNQGDNHRKRAIKNRIQVLDPKTNQYVKIDTETGDILGVKQNGTPFKGVTKEK